MKKYFITGLVTLLPLAVTIWIVHFLVNFLTRPFIGIMTTLTERLSIESSFIHIISPILILICLLLIMFLLGFVARRFFFSELLKFGDKILYKIPLVNKVYKTSKEIVKALFSSNANSFKQVVMVQFPYEGAFCIGLITKEAPKSFFYEGVDDLVSVFIPSTPNPSTGFLVMSHRSKLIDLEMKTEDAIKYIVSCAVIKPGEKEE